MPYRPEPTRTARLTLADEVPIYVHFWEPTAGPRGIVLYLHGLAEHARRYAEFAASLADQRWLAVIPDLRGHGLSADGRLGIAGPDGWNGMVRDALALITHLRDEHPGLPLFLGGYSMGSILAQRVAQISAKSLAGMFLLGTGYAASGYDGLVLAIRESEALGRDAPSEISRMVFQVLCNQPFLPITTPFDWLTSDAAAAAAYTADPHCGIPVSCGLYSDYQAAQALTMTPESYRQIPPELPFLIINGTEDTSAPVEYVIALIQKLAEHGAQDVAWRLYPAQRHDLLHETRRDEIERDILAWLELREMKTP